MAPYRKYGQCITPGCKIRGRTRGMCTQCYQKWLRRQKNNVCLSNPDNLDGNSDNPDIKRMTLGEKTNLLRNVCDKCKTIKDLTIKCNAIGFDDWHKIYSKMKLTGEIMTDGENIRRV